MNTASATSSTAVTEGEWEACVLVVCFFRLFVVQDAGSTKILKDEPRAHPADVVWSTRRIDRENRENAVSTGRGGRGQRIGRRSAILRAITSGDRYAPITWRVGRDGKKTAARAGAGGGVGCFVALCCSLGLAALR